MKVEAGTTFISRWGPTGVAHLWVVATSRFGDPPSVGVVSVSTRRRNSDTTCVLKPGDHPFIRNESVIAYTHLRVVTVLQIIEVIRSGQGEFREPVSESLLDRIQEGVRTSPYVVQTLRERCRAALY